MCNLIVYVIWLFIHHAYSDCVSRIFTVSMCDFRWGWKEIKSLIFSLGNTGRSLERCELPQSRLPVWSVENLETLYRQAQSQGHYAIERLDRHRSSERHRRSSALFHNCILLPSAGHENNTALPETDKWFSSPSHFSSFFTVQLLFKCRFVAW